MVTKLTNTYIKQDHTYPLANILSQKSKLALAKVLVMKDWDINMVLANSYKKESDNEEKK